MTGRKKKKMQDIEIPHQIFRREFAIGSVAMLGGYSIKETTTIRPLSPRSPGDETRYFPKYEKYHGSGTHT